MTDTAYFIKDRAVILAYEAIHFPQASKDMALAWLRRAKAWADARGYAELSESLRDGITEVEDHFSALDAGLMEGEAA